jgi:integrase
MPVKINQRHSVNYVKNRVKTYFSLVEALSKTENLRTKLVVSLILETGITPKEIVNLKISDIDFSNKRLNIRKEITKNNENRTIHLSKNLLRLIKDYFDSEKGYLISTKKSGKADVRTIQRIVREFSEIYGKRINSVELRKQFILNSLQEKTFEEVKKEAGLKRLDKRKILSQKEISDLKNSIKSERDCLIFELLISGVKSHEIVDLKSREIKNLEVPVSLIKKLRKFVLKRKIHRHEFVFLTRQNSHLSNERIFQVIKKSGKAAGVEVCPRILNNTALAAAISSDDRRKLNALGVKTRAFHLHGGFFKNE